MSNLNPMEVWNFLAPLILEFQKGEDRKEMYAMTYHALKLENDYRKENKNE